jgi:DNA-binding XRE family transcriptional regulator|nr:MAG TPA: Protein of unknown function (DUF739) [Caudoviricetes sp.]
MDAMELKIARIRKKKSAKDLAFAIGKSTASYNKKERGEVRFSSDEITTVTKELELTPEQVNAIFFDNNLPIRQVSEGCLPATKV